MSTNTTVESPTQNIQKQLNHMNDALSTHSQVLNPTLQRKVSSKIEITLGREQFKEARWLFNQYGLPKPSWLRGKFLLNQSRRKCLNDNLREAQLDKVFCGSCVNKDDWSGLLHSLWHDINGSPLCV